MLESQPVNRKKKKFIRKGLRMQIYAWCLLVGIVLLFGRTFAWFTLQMREAETEAAKIMKPYYLTLSNPSETDILSLSVGSLLQGNVKQIVFCVTSKEEEQINKDTATFEYALELVHTDNLALNYELYKLEKATEGEDDVIVAEDILVGDDSITMIRTTYWKKVGDALIGTDVSEERQEQAGGIAAVGDIEDIINRGTYTLYGQLRNNANTIIGVDNGLRLEPGQEAYASQYFVLEVSWDIVSGFERYEKETDMIYLLAKALQTEPEKE